MKKESVLIKVHPLTKVESLPYLKMLPSWYLSLRYCMCGHVVVCLRGDRELSNKR
jgi:hypothetical protein